MLSFIKMQTGLFPPRVHFKPLCSTNRSSCTVISTVSIGAAAAAFKFMCKFPVKRVSGREAARNFPSLLRRSGWSFFSFLQGTIFKGEVRKWRSLWCQVAMRWCEKQIEMFYFRHRMCVSAVPVGMIWHVPRGERNSIETWWLETNGFFYFVGYCHRQRWGSCSKIIYFGFRARGC